MDRQARRLVNKREKDDRLEIQWIFNDPGVDGRKEEGMIIGGKTKQEGNIKLSQTTYLKSDIYKTPMLNDTW